MVLYFAISIYFIMCVFSLYKILKIQKSSVIRFLDHEFEANEGTVSPQTSSKIIMFPLQLDFIVLWTINKVQDQDM